MPFLTEVHFQNYRSFLDAKCRLSPVTLVIGANNAGKSNFLRGIMCGIRGLLGEWVELGSDVWRGTPRDTLGEGLKGTRIRLKGIHADGQEGSLDWTAITDLNQPRVSNGLNLTVSLFHPDAGCEPEVQPVVERLQMKEDARDFLSVLLALARVNAAGFRALTEEFRTYVPEVSELSFQDWEGGNRAALLAVKEQGVDQPDWYRALSTGARAILMLLTILYQPQRPDVILLESIERDVHPRGIAEIIETMRRISAEHGVQFIFTSHHPYVLDCFRAKEHWGDVVIVEKKDGVSRLANMDDRLKRLHYEEEMDQVRLHELWYSGLMGGVANGPPIWDKEP